MADTDKHKEELVKSFCNVTGVTNVRARLYLESAAWNLDLSIASFYEESDEIEQDIRDVPTSVVEETEESNTKEPGKNSAPMKTSSNRVTTFANLTKEESSDEEGQTFYAGGSERSGQQVLGPGKKKTGNDIISQMFKSAKEHGAEVLDPSSSAASSSRGRSSAPFIGAGYKLGCSDNDSVVVGTADLKTKNQRPVEMILRLWKNGFSVDSGPLRDYQDPDNKDFLESITRGEIPRELIRQSQEVSLNMEDHRHEEFKEKKEKLQAFKGEGHRLGSPSPAMIAEAPSSSSKEREHQAQNSLDVKEEEATNNIQIRLADGSRVVARVNHSHRVADLRNFINLCRPQFAAVPYCLMTTFPNKELTDEEESVKDANLLNSVVVQRLK